MLFTNANSVSEFDSFFWRLSALDILHRRSVSSVYTNGRGHFDVKPVAYIKIVTDL